MGRSKLYFAAALAAASILASSASAQFYSMTPDQLKKFTAQWTGDRFPDGRPKVSDAILDKVTGLSSEEVNISRDGYNNQFADNLQNLHPRMKLVGRALTLQLAPDRPDVSQVIASEWRTKGNNRALNHQTAIDMIQKGDVIVIDSFGSLSAGGIIGDNLAYYIWKTSGTGFVIDGAIRDLDGIGAYAMPGFFKGAVPPAIHGTMVMGINIPVRVGSTTVMPGDVVFGDAEGVYFIPPHLAQGVVTAADVTHLHDEWTRKKFDEGKYKSTDIYGRPTDPALIKEYEDFLRSKLGAEGFAEYQRQQAQPQGGGRGGLGGGRGGPGAPGGAPPAPPAKKQ